MGKESKPICLLFLHNVLPRLPLALNLREHRRRACLRGEHLLRHHQCLNLCRLSTVSILGVRMLSCPGVHLCSTASLGARWDALWKDLMNVTTERVFNVSTRASDLSLLPVTADLGWLIELPEQRSWLPLWLPGKIPRKYTSSLWQLEVPLPCLQVPWAPMASWLQVRGATRAAQHRLIPTSSPPPLNHSTSSNG